MEEIESENEGVSIFLTPIIKEELYLKEEIDDEEGVSEPFESYSLMYINSVAKEETNPAVANYEQYTTSSCHYESDALHKDSSSISLDQQRYVDMTGNQSTLTIQNLTQQNQVPAGITLAQKSRHTTGPRKYQCNICNKLFNQSGSLSAHKVKHSFGKKFHWERSVKSCSLNQHKLTQSVKKYQCDVCDKSFNVASYLENHKLIHTGIKKYHCDICNKVFTHSASLYGHKLTHSGIKKYQCDVCNISFYRPLVLAAHKLTHK